MDFIEEMDINSRLYKLSVNVVKCADKSYIVTLEFINSSGSLVDYVIWYNAILGKNELELINTSGLCYFRPQEKMIQERVYKISKKIKMLIVQKEGM